jgi:hypothetical protein
MVSILRSHGYSAEIAIVKSIVDKSPLQCAGIPYEKGVAIHSASSLALLPVRDTVKRRQRYRWAGLLSFEKGLSVQHSLRTHAT